MIVPDKIVFCTNSEGKAVYYGDVRAVEDESTLIDLLRVRLNGYMVNQIQSSQDAQAAFPLAILTCVAIETLGQIFVEEKNGDSSFQFVEIIKKVSQVFGRNMNKDFEKRLVEIWGEKEVTKIDCYGKLLYKYFRNTMVHGYQAKGVFLSYENVEEIEIDKDSGFITMNPNWFWNSYRKTFDKIFSEVLFSEKNNSMRINCIKYIHEFLLK